MKRRDFIGLSGVCAVGSRFPKAHWLDYPHALERGRFAQEDPRFRDISALIEAKMREYRIPGVAFGLVKSGATAVRGFGQTNVDNPQPVTPDTVFPIMSITKTVVAVAVLRLVEQGKLALDAPVREYLPDFKVRDREATETVTLRHLLTHTPGWEGQVAGVDNGVSHHAVLVAGMADNPQLARPGELWSYNNLGFGVASRVLEVVTGSGIHEALRSLVFAPLSLDRAFTQTGTAMTYPFAAPHVEADDRTVVSRPFQLPADTGAGGGAMSLTSLMSYARFHLGAEARGDPVLKPASLELMRTPQLVKRPTADEMGVGWHLRRVKGVLTAVQCGTGGGHCLHLQIVPARNLAFALLTNHGRGWRLNTIVERAVLEAYEGLTLDPGQATGGNRGGNEDMTTHAARLERQPSIAEYLGKYDRTPVSGYELVSRGGRLIVSTSNGEQPLAFWGPDLAYLDIEGVNRGVPVEFIRDAGGNVRWLRNNGRIARKV